MADTTQKSSDQKAAKKAAKKTAKKAAKKTEDQAAKKTEDQVEEKPKPKPPRVRATTMAATEILPNLFIGTREDAEALGERLPNDWACISVTEFRSRYKRTEELPLEPVGSLDMPFMIDWPEGWHADPHKLDLIAETIWMKLQLGKKVLVHCIHAQERAPLTAAWYLAWSGAAPSILHAYTMITKLHARTERRDKWLRGTPSKSRSELGVLLVADAARELAPADSQSPT